MNTGVSTVRLFGFRFITSRRIADVAAALMADTANQGVRHLITPNASTIVYYNEARHAHLKRFYASCSYILPDGMPVVWLSRLKSSPPLHRLPGSDLFPALWRMIRETGLPAVFVVANNQLAERLRAEHPECGFVVPRMFDATDRPYVASLADDVVAAVREVKANFVFLGLNFPKQETLGMEIGSRLAGDAAKLSVTILLLGATFEFYFGLKPRAPRWMQQYGLEWLHRFMQEPGRLWKRYTIDNLRFLGLACRELVRRESRD